MFFNPPTFRGDLTIFLGARGRGLGLGKKAIVAVVDWFFAEAEARNPRSVRRDCLIASSLATNTASRELFGFIFDADAPTTRLRRSSAEQLDLQPFTLTWDAYRQRIEDGRWPSCP